MFVLTLERGLFKFTADGPALPVLLELPDKIGKLF